MPAKSLIVTKKTIKTGVTKMNKKKSKMIEQNLVGTYFAEDTTVCSIDDHQDLIRKRAYELYLAHGNTPDRSLEDWLQAEREINHHLNA